MTKLVAILTLTTALCPLSGRGVEQDITSPVPADLLVYGGTASGIMTAYSAAREGLHVVLLEPSGHIGGMVTGGLSATDSGQFQVIGGYTRQFYMQAAEHYGRYDLNHPQNWYSEPHVDESIFRSWLQQSGVDVRLHERLQEHNAVLKQGTRIVSVETDDHRHWNARIFADCSYEGDLMAQSGVSYTVGREGTRDYGESLAGVRADTPRHQFHWKVSGWEKDHRLLLEVGPGPLAPPGSADDKVQAYNYRLILTDDPTNRLPWVEPRGYDPREFELLARYLDSFAAHMGHAPTVEDLMIVIRIPNHKADFNNNGPFSTDYLGKSWKYPDASYAVRGRITGDHLRYTEGFMYFLAHDPRVPKSLREEMNRWGLPKDEFQDTEYWPNQLYIREGRRMRGVYIMRQSDLQTRRQKPDSIGMGSYNSDSHNVQRIALADGSVQNEGNVEVPVQPYEIPYRSILPIARQATNLLVPVCLSATHVAYSSLRMEPQYMIIGQAAGTAAALAVKVNSAVQTVSVSQLQRHLLEAHSILHVKDAQFP